MAASCKVLVVDDDAEQRRSLVLGLTLCGFSVAEAASGVDALAMLAEASFSVAMVDLMMPGMNGVQLIRELRGSHPEVPVVLTSGYHLSRSQLERIGGRAVMFVPKPYNLPDLAELLAEAANGRPGLPAPTGGEISV